MCFILILYIFVITYIKLYIVYFLQLYSNFLQSAAKAKAKILGERKGKWKFWIPPSAEDFTGLMYPLLAKGKAGEKQMEFIKKNLLDPWAKSMANLQQDRLNLMLDFRQLKKT